MKTYEQFKEYMADGQDDAHDQEIFLLNLKADLLEIENDLERELDTINQPPYSFHNFNVDDLLVRYPLFCLKNEIGEIAYRTSKLSNYVSFLNGG